jgi:hypothetical protein
LLVLGPERSVISNWSVTHADAACTVGADNSAQAITTRKMVFIRLS